MTRPVRVDQAAEAEILHARQWYERHQVGLGDRLLANLAEAFERIQASPESCSPFQGSLPLPVRTARVKWFPFRVVFLEMPDRLRVIALAHARSRPGYWRDRLDAPLT